MVGVKERCRRTGRKPYYTYEAALAALVSIDPAGVGSVYTCGHCGEYHVSRRMFTLTKKRGRGKSRDGIVYWNSGRAA